MPGLPVAATLRKNTGEVLDTISRVLEPYIGRLMARTSATAHCNDLGIRSAVVDGQQIEALLEKLGLALIIFLGKDKAATVVDAMRTAIQSLGDAR
ncbi:MAG TPA: hypothetical protein VFR31_11660 [Thermoanaerobaculia bacterium]|nr:hypothetical protein [Thermoanaerobaculia bacterium]